MIKQKNQELAQIQKVSQQEVKTSQECCVQINSESIFLSTGKILSPFTLLSAEPNKKIYLLLSNIQCIPEKVGAKSTTIKALVNEEMLDTEMLAVLRDNIASVCDMEAQSNAE